MLLKKNVKVGTFVWCTGSQDGIKLSFPGVIRQITSSIVSVQSFEDFSWVEFYMKRGQSPSLTLHNLRLCKKIEVTDYIERRAVRLNDAAWASKCEAEDARTKLKEYKKKAKGAFPKLKI